MKIDPNILHKLLIEEFGSLNWWPMDKNYHELNGSDPRFEIIIGAILTQNTAWSNVEKALSNLKSQNMLNIENISEMHIEKLQELIKSSGFFKQKAKRLKDFAVYLKNNYNGDLDYFFNRDIHNIRQELLAINGIGHETADSIILYAGNLPIFVVDAYTKRICERLPLNTNTSYKEIQNYFETELSSSYNTKDLTKIYNELHAMIVILAKTYCKKNPDCAECPLKKHCDFKK